MLLLTAKYWPILKIIALIFQKMLLRESTLQTRGAMGLSVVCDCGIS